jgi:hypothetical protein
MVKTIQIMKARGGDIKICKLEAPLDASKEVSIEVNVEKTKSVFIYRHQTTGQNHYIKVFNDSVEM